MTPGTSAAPVDPFQERKDQVERYFRPAPYPPARASSAEPVTAVITGPILAFFGGQLIGFLPLVIGILICIYGCVQLSKNKAEWKRSESAYQSAVASALSKPSGKQIDSWLAHSVAEVKKEGLRRLDLTPDQISGARHDAHGSEPLEVLGIPSRNSHVRFIRDPQDGRSRFSHYSVTVVYLTKWKLCAFQCVLDMATGALSEERTYEFHYQHINTVRTESDRVTLPGATPGSTSGGTASADVWLWDPYGYPVHLTSEQRLEIGVAGDRLTVTVNISDDQQFGVSDPTMVDMRSRADITIQQVRRQLQYYSGRGRGGVGSLDEDAP